MNLRDQLLKENSRRNWQDLVNYIGNDVSRCDDLMKLVFSGANRESQLSSQVLTMVADRHPYLVEPYVDRLVKNLKNNPNQAVRRNTMRIFQSISVSEEAEGDLFETGVSYLKSAEEPIAVKAFAMTALRRICEKYPELAAELIPHIEILVEEKASAGIVNRGEKELKKLRAILSSLI